MLRWLGSLNLGLWLMAGVVLLLGIGSFAGGEGAATINAMPLFTWLREMPPAATWWLWLTVALLALLAVNTVVCSLQAIGRRYGQVRLLSLLAPQLMHLGFLLVVVAHLISSVGGEKGAMQVPEGAVVEFPGGSTVRIDGFYLQAGPMGMPTDYRARVRYLVDGREEARTVAPNHPFFLNGYGLYLKELAPPPMNVALVEIHREPGAGVALAGALLFTVGNILLLALRRGQPTA
jgi:cytochrome c biogenesis protein ResB